MDTGYNFLESGFAQYESFVLARAVAVMCCFFLIIFLTNVFLTRFVFKKIVFALDTLEYGVSEISDGNLNYRIRYAEADEFAGVCANFNGMAARLLDSVNLRQKDEDSRRELIAGISHDLRTPLTAIRGCVEGIGQGLASTPEMLTRYVGIIQNKVRDLEQIIDTLFHFSRLELGEFPWRMERVDPEKELRSVVTDLQSEYAQRGLDVSFKAESEGTLWVNVDVQQMRNAMINILENSLKYKTKERAKMEISLSRENQRAVVTMADDGPGVAEEMRDRLFDVFFRGDASRNSAKKGHGMGLAIVAKIVKSFGGNVSAENADGLFIRMELPLIEEGANN
jgi:signal transduction histidine kinase